MDPTEHCRNRPHGSVAAQVEVVHKDGASQQAASSVRAEPDRAALKRTADARIADTHLPGEQSKDG